MQSLIISVVLYSHIINIPKILFYEAYFYYLNGFIVIIYVFAYKTFKLYILHVTKKNR